MAKKSDNSQNPAKKQLAKKKSKEDGFGRQGQFCLSDSRGSKQARNGPEIVHLSTRKRTRPAVTPEYLKGKSEERICTVLENHRRNEKNRYDNYNHYIDYIGNSILPQSDQNDTRNLKSTNILFNLVVYISFLETKLTNFTGCSLKFLITQKIKDSVFSIVRELNQRVSVKPLRSSKVTQNSQESYPSATQTSWSSNTDVFAFSELPIIGSSSQSSASDSIMPSSQCFKSETCTPESTIDNFYSPSYFTEINSSQFQIPDSTWRDSPYICANGDVYDSCEHHFNSFMPRSSNYEIEMSVASSMGTCEALYDSFGLEMLPYFV